MGTSSTPRARRSVGAWTRACVLGVAPLSIALFGSSVRAQVAARDLFRAMRDTGAETAPGKRILVGRALLPALVEIPDGNDVTPPGVARLSPGWAVTRASLPDLMSLSNDHPDWRVTWSPPLRPLMDRASQLTRAVELRNATGRTGRNTFVGIVDTGVDVFHPDFRNADGTTRVAYYVDFSAAPRGIHADEEAQCPSTLPCAVFTRDDIDAALRADDRSVLSADVNGHGTHVASLAAGNGGPSGKYAGIAPGADLVAVAAADSQGQFSDAAVAVATGMVFWLAEQEGSRRGTPPVPAVVNLSLGSNIGPHDGTAPLERALASYVGPDHPGRAIAVAAGNNAGVYVLPTDHPSPRGIHTEVHVTDGSRVRVPIVTDPLDTTTAPVNASIVVWLELRKEDALSVGLDRGAGTWVSPRPTGTAGSFSVDLNTVTAVIVNGSVSKLGGGFDDTRTAAAVVIEGTWPRTETFTITLEGHGTADLWIESYGDLGPESGSLGALFLGATKESTVSIPAGHPDLIAVGATLNRTDWIDRSGDPVSIGRFGPLIDPAPDSLVFFSGAGPTADGRVKPDLVAPGARVVGAMGSGADPTTSPLSIFASSPFCETDPLCSIVDDEHAVTLGTSMSAPMVTGAVALMLEAEPTLSTDRILARLQAGARFPSGTVALDPQLGAGSLDLMGLFDVEELERSPEARIPSPERSWLTMGATRAHPDPSFPVPVLLQVRDDMGRAVPVETGDLEAEVSAGRASDFIAVAPGLVSFSAAADSGTGGRTLSVQIFHRGQLLAERSVPISVDVNVGRGGFSSRGGCAIGVSVSERGADAPVWLSLAALIVARGTRRRSAARRARSRGRTGTTARALRDSSPR